MTRLTLALALLGVLAIFLFTLSGAASAHDNCVETNDGGWQLTGCITSEGTVSWSAIGPDGNLYQWVDGEWKLQAPPALPEIKPRILVPTSRSFPFIGAGTQSFSPHVVYEAERSRTSGAVRSLIQIAAVSSSSGRAWLQIYCGADNNSVQITFLHDLQFPHMPSGIEEIPLAMHVDGARVLVGQLPDYDPKASPSERIAQIEARIAILSRTSFKISGDRSSLSASWPKWLYEQLRDGDQLDLRIREFTDPVVFRFDLAALFDTPIQENIDRCGG